MQNKNLINLVFPFKDRANTNYALILLKCPDILSFAKESKRVNIAGLLLFFFSKFSQHVVFLLN